MTEKPLDSQSLYLEDLAPGPRWVSATLRVEQAAIRAVAEQFDPQPFHLDPVAARSTFFEGLAASGWHTAALTMRLLVTGGLRLAGGIPVVHVEESHGLPGVVGRAAGRGAVGRGHSRLQVVQTARGIAPGDVFLIERAIHPWTRPCTKR